MKALDLFSGIGGNTLALQDVVQTVAYCDADPHARAVLKSRMSDGLIGVAPVFDDIRTLSSKDLGDIDIVIAGFPCQDISVAGKGAGITNGSRSCLFFEVMRIVDECRPEFIFLENVPAIRTRGLDVVLRELTERRYDCRWTMLQAAQVGARHRRERWFLLAHANQGGLPQERAEQQTTGTSGKGGHVSDTSEQRLQGAGTSIDTNSEREKSDKQSTGHDQVETGRTIESGLGGVAYGIPDRMDDGLRDYLGRNYWKKEPENISRVTKEKRQRVERIKRLGNAVVPLQARTAFFYLARSMQSVWG